MSLFLWIDVGYKLDVERVPIQVNYIATQIFKIDRGKMVPLEDNSSKLVEDKIRVFSGESMSEKDMIIQFLKLNKLGVYNQDDSHTNIPVGYGVNFMLYVIMKRAEDLKIESNFDIKTILYSKTTFDLMQSAYIMNQGFYQGTGLKNVSKFDGLYKGKSNRKIASEKYYAIKEMLEFWMSYNNMPRIRREYNNSIGKEVSALKPKNPYRFARGLPDNFYKKKEDMPVQKLKTPKDLEKKDERL